MTFLITPGTKVLVLTGGKIYLQEFVSANYPDVVLKAISSEAAPLYNLSDNIIYAIKESGEITRDFAIPTLTQDQAC